MGTGSDEFSAFRHPLRRSHVTGGTKISIDLAQSQSFARLSGDFNPMHVDPVRARRTQYGSTVVHGMHLLLKALDDAVGRGLIRPRQIQQLSVLFNNPALTHAQVSLSFSVEEQPRRLRISGDNEGRTLFTATLTLDDDVDEHELPGEAAPESERAPREVAFPQNDAPALEGTVPWQVARGAFSAHFPSLGRAPGGLSMAADLLASTRIVGMECPGLHSIYSALKLKRCAKPTQANQQGMRWRASRTDARFRLLRMAVTGGVFEGSIEAFFRPAPVEQPTLSSLLKGVAPGQFAGQRALVVGGSRGLGELTAKLLMAGGGEVTITYARGRQDAERVCKEAGELDRRCEPLFLDLRGEASTAGLADARRGSFTHVYFFASPQIAKGVPGQWRASLFQTYADFYLKGFTDLMAAVVPAGAGGGSMRVLYPSTVFLDTAEKGFAEYCAAKAAGEALCAQLAAHYGIRIDHPRLPRMRTDQTSALVEVDTEDALPVLQRMLRDFCAD